MARPRSETEPLRSTVAAVVNRQEREQIERIAEATGTSLSDVVRQGIRVVLTASAGLGCQADPPPRRE
jgi:hypothetical protein